MYKIEVEIEEIKPGIIAFKAKPVTNQNTTDTEQEAGDMMNAHIGNMIAAIGRIGSESEVVTGTTGEATDQLFEGRKDVWRDRDIPPSNRN